MTQARDFSRDFARDRGIGRAWRFSFRRRARPAARRSQFVRSDVRRGPQGELEWWPLPQMRQAPVSAYEKVMTLRLQAAIVAAMLGLSLFFHAPLAAAVAGLFR